MSAVAVFGYCVALPLSEGKEMARTMLTVVGLSILLIVWCIEQPPRAAEPERAKVVIEVVAKTTQIPSHALTIVLHPNGAFSDADFHLMAESELPLYLRASSRGKRSPASHAFVLELADPKQTSLIVLAKKLAVLEAAADPKRDTIIFLQLELPSPRASGKGGGR